MLAPLLTFSLVVIAQAAQPKLVSFELPPAEKARSVFNQAAPRDWATAYAPVTLARTFVDPEKEGEFIHSQLDHVRGHDLDAVFAPVRDFGVAGFDKVATNGPLLRERLIGELALMETARRRKGYSATIYPIPSAGEFGVMVGALAVPFAKTTENPDTLEMTTVFFVTAEQGAVLRHIAETLERYEQSRHDGSRLKTAERLADVNNGWKNYLQNGYSQYPWELLLNSALYRGPWYEPPTHQIVLFHPEVGFAADVLHGASDTDFDPSLMIHALGYIQYTGTANDTYFGGSLSFMYEDDDRLAAGFAAHLGLARLGVAIPAFSVGVYWKDFDNGLSSNNLELGISVDVLRIFDREGGDQTFLNRALGL